MFPWRNARVEKPPNHSNPCFGLYKLYVLWLIHRHRKQKEEDIAICDCKLDPSDPDSACAERCLNVLTSTECTPTYCPCNFYCRNQVHPRHDAFSYVYMYLLWSTSCVYLGIILVFLVHDSSKFLSLMSLPLLYSCMYVWWDCSVRMLNLVNLYFSS